MSKPAPRASRVAFSSLLFTAMIASTFAIPAVSVLSGLLIEDLGISRSQLGWLITLSAGATTLLATTGWRLTDRIGGRTMLMVLFGATIASMAVMSLAPHDWVVAAAVLIAGLPNAAGNPATNKLIVAQAPPGERGTIMGIKQSGVPAGIFLSGLTLPGLAIWLGWRGAVAVAMLVPLFGLIATVALLPQDRPARVSLGERVPYRHTGAIRWIAAYAFLMGSGGAGVVSFLPLYAHESLGMTVPLAGAAAAILGLVGVPARIVWAREVDRSGRHLPALATLGIVSMVATLGILVAEVVGAWLLWVSVVLAGMTVVAWNAVTYTVAVAVAEDEHAGRATGLIMCGFMMGFTVMPVAIGWSVDATGRYRPAWVLVAAMFAAAAMLIGGWGQRERQARTAPAGEDDQTATAVSKPRRWR